MCLGAYTSALLMKKAAVPFVLAAPIGGLIAGMSALLFAYPFMRVKGIYFIILTVMTAETIRNVALYWRGFTGGMYGLVAIPSPGVITIPDIARIDFGGLNEYYFLTLTVVCASLFVLYRLEKSELGFIWAAIREGDQLSGSLGINILRYKSICFSVACTFAGVSGVLLAHFERSMSPQSSSAFGVMNAIYYICLHDGRRKIEICRSNYRHSCFDVGQ